METTVAALRMKLRLSVNEVNEEKEEIDYSVWESLDAKIDDVLGDKNMAAQASVFSPDNIIIVNLVYD